MQYWKAQEYRIRDLFRKYGWEAKRIPCSGASEAVKGDVVAIKGKLRLFIDHKSTRGSKSISLKREDLEKVADQAGGDIPVMSISFYGDRDIYVILRAKDFLKIIDI